MKRRRDWSAALLGRILNASWGSSSKTDAVGQLGNRRTQHAARESSSSGQRSCDHEPRRNFSSITSQVHSPEPKDRASPIEGG
jgi:hypothetical protein